jgi:hypothetical protein
MYIPFADPLGFLHRCRSERLFGVPAGSYKVTIVLSYTSPNAGGWGGGGGAG